MPADNKSPKKMRRSSLRGEKKSHTGRNWLIGIFLFLLLMGGIAYASDYVMTEGTVPRGVTVEDVHIGGMTKPAAERVLRDRLGPRVRQEVTIHAGDMDSTLEPSFSGLHVDWKKTVDRAGEQPLNPWTRIRSFWSTRPVPIANSVNEDLLASNLSRVKKELTRDPKNAQISLGSDGKAQIVKPVNGQQVEFNVLLQEVSEHWLNASGIVEVPVTVWEPPLGKKALKQIQRDVIDKVTSAPVKFRGDKEVEAIVEPRDMGRFLTFRGEGDHFVPEWNRQELEEILAPQLASTVREPREAKISVNGEGEIQILQGSEDGRVVNWDATIDPIDQKFMDPEKREFDVTYDDVKPKFTTEMAQRADFTHSLGEYSSRQTPGDQRTNIRIAAAAIDGIVVMPGEVFSFNQQTGPRTEAQGYAAAQVIRDGRSGSEVGAGVDQLAATLYNAAYLSGMELVEHTPRSTYDSRFPAGRDATVSDGAIDLKFKNTSYTPVLVRASISGSTVTARIMGSPTVSVRSETSSRTNEVQPGVLTVSEANCVPNTGTPGFTVTDTRIVQRLGSDEVVSRTSTTTTYSPESTIRCAQSTNLSPTRERARRSDLDDDAENLLDRIRREFEN